MARAATMLPAGIVDEPTQVLPVLRRSAPSEGVDMTALFAQEHQLPPHVRIYLDTPMAGPGYTLRVYAYRRYAGSIKYVPDGGSGVWDMWTGRPYSVSYSNVRSFGLCLDALRRVWRF